ncbi:phage integrase N-terminal SAM-like domain-containing protein [Aphanothece hegewaldii]
MLEQVNDVIRVKHYSYKTDKSYINWGKQYIFFYQKYYLCSSLK